MKWKTFKRKIRLAFWKIFNKRKYAKILAIERALSRDEAIFKSLFLVDSREKDLIKEMKAFEYPKMPKIERNDMVDAFGSTIGFLMENKKKGKSEECRE